MVVEQADNNFFNKALLMNAAFQESSKIDEFNCFIFHDVDMIPENHKLNYTCNESPTDLSPSGKKISYIANLPFYLSLLTI